MRIGKAKPVETYENLCIGEKPSSESLSSLNSIGFKGQVTS